MDRKELARRGYRRRKGIGTSFVSTGFDPAIPGSILYDIAGQIYVSLGSYDPVLKVVTWSQPKKYE